MIDAPPTVASGTGPPDDLDEVVPAPDRSADAAPSAGGAPPTRRRRRRSSGWWRYGFPIAMVLLVAAVPVLVYAGARTVLDSNDGRLVNRVTDPAAPGWEAIVEPTPTDLVVAVDADGTMLGASVLVLTGQGSGAVLQIPAETLVPITVDGVKLPGISLAYEWTLTGMDGVRARVGDLLNLELTDAQAVTAPEWAALVGQAGPLAVSSPDPAVDESGRVVFPQGTIQLAPTDVASYLSVQGRNESDLARLVRVEAFWKAWLEAVGSSGGAALPDPVDQGLGLFLGTLGSEAVRYEILPVTPEPGPGGEVYLPIDDEVAAVVAELVPFPRGAPGMRPTVRVLDGTGQLDHGVDAAVVLGASGAQVEVIGNATDFGVSTTEITYYDPALADEAERLRDALGVGSVEQSDQKSAIDITVVLGTDAMALGGTSAAVPGTAAGGATGG
jgi:hypothetical protein